MKLSKWFLAYQNMDLRRRGQWLLVLSIFLGVLAAFAFISQLNHVKSAVGESVPVIVAKAEIRAYTVIKQEMLAETKIPRAYMLPDMIPASDRDKVIGKVTLIPIPPRSLISDSMLRDSGAQDPNKRTYALASSRQVVFQGLKAGDIVDLMAVFEDGKGQGGTNVIAKDVQVLDAWNQGGVDYVNLSLTSEQAMQVAYYENFSRQLRLLKRG